MKIHPTALVAPGARLGEGTTVGPFAVVEDGAVLGDGCEVRAHAVVKSHAVLGAENVVFEGTVIGGEPQDLGFKGGATRLVIGDRNVFREGVTVNRASKPDGVTVIGSGCFLMACSHVAHECRLGDGVILANNTLLAGHVELGDRAFLGGAVAIHQFTRVGRLAMIGGMTRVAQDCLPFVTTVGYPARARSLNLVGLRRAGIAPPQIRNLQQAFRALLRSNLPLETALQTMAEMGDPLVDDLVAFVRAAKRGFAHLPRKGEAEE
jgi:UDP-N-acetylglucosamine acyltransferase